MIRLKEVYPTKEFVFVIGADLLQLKSWGRPEYPTLASIWRNATFSWSAGVKLLHGITPTVNRPESHTARAPLLPLCARARRVRRYDIPKDLPKNLRSSQARLASIVTEDVVIESVGG